jgi:hypothetical protein
VVASMRLCCLPAYHMHPSINRHRESTSQEPDAIPGCIGVDINLDRCSCHAFGFLGAQQNRHRTCCCCWSIRRRSRCPTHSASTTIVTTSPYRNKSMLK